MESSIYSLPPTIASANKSILNMIDNNMEMGGQLTQLKDKGNTCEYVVRRHNVIQCPAIAQQMSQGCSSPKGKEKGYKLSDPKKKKIP